MARFIFYFPCLSPFQFLGVLGTESPVRSRQGGNVPLPALCPKELFPSEASLGGDRVRQNCEDVFITCASTHRRLKEVSHPLPGMGLKTLSASMPISLCPVIRLQCFKKQVEYVTPVKHELLPSAAPSARDFFINGKDQSLKMVQMSSTAPLGWSGMC